MAGHATLSPSSAARWLHCPGSIALTRGMADDSSEFAAEGTAAHFLAEQCLTAGVDAITHKGARIGVPTNGAAFWGDASALGDGRTFDVDDEMVEHVQKYLDYVRALGGELMIEQRLPITPITGEPDAFGTSDAVVLLGDECICVDLKFGRGVKVDAERNEQLSIYAAAALNEFGVLGDFKRVRLVIVQPRLNHVSEWDMPIDAPDGEPSMRGFLDRIKPRAERALAIVNGACATDADFSPSDKTCQWCRAKATCQKLTQFVAEQTGLEFEALIDEPTPEALTLVEEWAKAKRADLERRLFAGEKLKFWKLVEGRRGSRAWSSEEEAEAALKSMRLKAEQMYDYKLISPTTAEKLAKSETIGKRQWAKLQTLITQSNGSPSVAPVSDKRPALVVTPTADEFEDVSAQGLV